LLPARRRNVSMRSFGNGGEYSIHTGRSCTICAAPARNGVKSTQALSRISRCASASKHLASPACSLFPTRRSPISPSIVVDIELTGWRCRPDLIFHPSRRAPLHAPRKRARRATGVSRPPIRFQLLLEYSEFSRPRSPAPHCPSKQIDRSIPCAHSSRARAGNTPRMFRASDGHSDERRQVSLLRADAAPNPERQRSCPVRAGRRIGHHRGCRGILRNRRWPTETAAFRQSGRSHAHLRSALPKRSKARGSGISRYGAISAAEIMSAVRRRLNLKRRPRLVWRWKARNTLAMRPVAKRSYSALIR
jgi:hypothetical protein